MMEWVVKLVCLLLLSSTIQAQRERLESPVLDAKHAYQKGIIEFVGIQLEQELLLPGIKAEEQGHIRTNYPIRPLNHHWKTLANSEENPRRLYQFKRYANRYNLTINRLIKAEKLEQALRYRY